MHAGSTHCLGAAASVYRWRSQTTASPGRTRCPERAHAWITAHSVRLARGQPSLTATRDRAGRAACSSPRGAAPPLLPPPSPAPPPGHPPKAPQPGTPLPCSEPGSRRPSAEARGAPGGPGLGPGLETAEPPPPCALAECGRSGTGRASDGGPPRPGPSGGRSAGAGSAAAAGGGARATGGNGCCTCGGCAHGCGGGGCGSGCITGPGLAPQESEQPVHTKRTSRLRGRRMQLVGAPGRHKHMSVNATGHALCLGAT